MRDLQAAFSHIYSEIRKTRSLANKKKEREREMGKEVTVAKVLAIMMPYDTLTHQDDRRNASRAPQKPAKQQQMDAPQGTKAETQIGFKDFLL